MKYHELNATPNTAKKRVGRGNGSGHGTTAGRGTKGQLARTGKKLSPTFMGGQGPLVRRIPKLKGFTSMRVPSQVVYLDQLTAFKNKTADNFSLFEAGLVSTPHHSIKIIVRGELKEKVTVKVQAASAASVQAIEKAGGSFEKVTVPLKKKQK